ncbi:toluene tolerance protein Ttg2D [beta proteobacterium KB13]|uniref:Toluene tolerance protein Ttg2D n=1 Tax=beta proteobacterium KB13 TaxID=314607 RepID=B6BVB5_9PROT|nr:toluene tolerance protein Ttg2D [beta proteobacterium KB13]
MNFFKNLLLSFFLSLSFTSIAEDGPLELVQKTADDVLSVLKSDQSLQEDKEKIYQLAEEKILPNFDLDRISMLVLGKAWRKINEDQQQKFKTEFKTMLLRTYAVALGKYKDQEIDFKPLRMEPTDNKATVKSQIIQDGAQPISVDYTLAKKDNAWKVFDIVIEGVSLVTNYRSQFASEIKNNGIDSLISKLVEKNNKGD